MSASTTSAASAGALVTSSKTPGGSTVFRTSTMRAWTPGVTSDAFRTTVFPHASGAASARTPRMTGAFQGAIPTTTPAG